MRPLQSLYEVDNGYIITRWIGLTTTSSPSSVQPPHNPIATLISIARSVHVGRRLGITRSYFGGPRRNSEGNDGDCSKILVSQQSDVVGDNDLIDKGEPVAWPQAR